MKIRRETAQVGVVFRARDDRPKRDVGVKELTPELVGDSERKGCFIQEALAASRFRRNRLGCAAVYFM